jgi:hypothetical protein
MRPMRNSDKLRLHIDAMRSQITSLQDSKIEAVINRQFTLVELLDIQIECLTDRLKAQVDIVDVAQSTEPQYKNWWQPFKSKDRLESIMD